MRERIADEIHRDSDDDRISRAIIDAINEWKYTRLGFNVREWELQTTADEDEYHFPVLDVNSNYIVPIEIDNCRILVNNFWHSLLPINFDVFQTDINIRNNNSSGIPTYYTIGPYDTVTPEGRLFILNPDPNDEYTVRGYGLCDISNITLESSSSSTNAWFTTAELLTRTQAKINLFVNNYQSQEDAAILVPQLVRARNALLKASSKMDTTQPVPWY